MGRGCRGGGVQGVGGVGGPLGGWVEGGGGLRVVGVQRWMGRDCGGGPGVDG